MSSLPLTAQLQRSAMKLRKSYQLACSILYSHVLCHGVVACVSLVHRVPTASGLNAQA